MYLNGKNVTSSIGRMIRKIENKIKENMQIWITKTDFGRVQLPRTIWTAKLNLSNRMLFIITIFFCCIINVKTWDDLTPAKFWVLIETTNISTV